MERLIAFVESTPALLLMVLGFGFLIFVHELGHFLAARAVGIKVTQFAIGIGPAVGSWRKGVGFLPGSTEPEYARRIEAAAREVQPDTGEALNISPDLEARLAKQLSMSETEYRLNWLPLGGYVKMLGQEDLAPDAVSEDSRSFSAKPAWARAIVLSAGVVMNLIFGLLFFIVAFMAGVEFPPAEVGDVSPNSPAAVAYAQGHEGNPAFRGLLPGDVVTHVNGKRATDFMDVRIASALAARNDVMEITVRREGVTESLRYRMTPEEERSTRLLAVGIVPPSAMRIADFKLVPRMLETSGISPGMRLTAVDGQPVARMSDVHTLSRRSQGHPMELTFVDDTGDSRVTYTAKPQPTLQIDIAQQTLHLLGLVPVTSIEVMPGTPAEAAGALDGDVIARIGDVPWPTTLQVQQVVQRSSGAPIAMTVLRDDALVDLEPAMPDAQGRLGIGMVPVVHGNRIATVLPASPFEPLSIAPGSRVVAVQGEAIADFSSLQRVLHNHLLTTDPNTGQLTPVDSPTVEISIERAIADAPVVTQTITLDADTVLPLTYTSWKPDPIVRYFEVLRVPVAADTPWAATVLGVRKTHQFMVQTYVTIVRLAQQTVKVEHLRGVVGIADEGTRIARQGWTYLLFFLGLISINLAVMNFLPIPILDGGQMVFLIVEKIKGSPVSVRVQNLATYVGLAIIGSLLIVTFYNDTLRLFGS